MRHLAALFIRSGQAREVLGTDPTWAEVDGCGCGGGGGHRTHFSKDRGNFEVCR